jgi:CubicO group peptidase (beta-lactamase class C family)
VIVHDLLTHSSGLGYGLETTDPLEARWHAADLLRMDESLEEKMPRIAALPLHHQPGLRYTYSIGTDVLARIVEVASGQAFDEFLEARVFGPLGMADTGFFVPPSKLERLASLYTPGPDGRLVDAASLDLSAAPHFMKGAWIDKSKKPRFLSGGGGLVSTASDYLRFALMLKNGGAFEGERILGRKTVELMTSPFLTGERFPIPGCAYGLGLTILTSPALARFPGSPGSFGGGGAANTDFWVDPSEDLVGILMVQLASTSPCPVAQDFRATALQAVVE